LLFVVIIVELTNKG